GLRAMPPSAAIERLAGILASNSAPRVVADVNWALFKELFESRGRRPLLDRVGRSAIPDGARAESALATELRALDSAMRRERLMAFVQQEIGVVLGWTSARPVDLRRGFFDLGMDS